MFSRSLWVVLDTLNSVTVDLTYNQLPISCHSFSNTHSLLFSFLSSSLGPYHALPCSYRRGVLPIIPLWHFYGISIWHFSGTSPGMFLPWKIPPPAHHSFPKETCP